MYKVNTVPLNFLHPLSEYKRFQSLSQVRKLLVEFQLHIQKLVRCKPVLGRKVALLFFDCQAVSRSFHRFLFSLTKETKTCNYTAQNINA